VTEISRREVLLGGAAAAMGIGLSTTLGACGDSGKKSASKTSTSQAQTRDRQAAIDDLRKRLKGQVLVPGDPAYATTGLPANGRYASLRPLAIAQCVDEADVVTCVNWSRQNGSPPVGRGGGHSYAGYSTTDGLLIDVAQLNSVSVDRASATAVVGGGAHNQNIYDATHDGPLFLPGGTCLGVGVGGLALGGGIGYNTHWAGLTCDHLLHSRIVTADGSVLDLDPTTNADLFWACRGGAGGNFGINTQFTFKFVEAPPNVAWYRFDWTGADATGAVFSAFHKILENAPNALNAVASSQAMPVGAGGPREALATFSRGQYIGPIDELRDLIKPLLDAAPPTKQVLQVQTFWDTLRGYTTPPETSTHSFGDISRYANKPIPDSAVAKVVDLLSTCPSRSDAANGSFWSLGWIGGQANSVKRTDTAYVHREMMSLLRPTPVWPNDAPASVANDLEAWTDDVVKAIAPHTPSESYQNFPNRSLPDPLKQYYAENLPRLVAIKNKHDPKNLFRNPQSIPTRL
jgi:FAD/FMN-containing dehydrogenase